MCLIVYKKYQLVNHLDMNCNFMCKKKIKSVEYTLTSTINQIKLMMSSIYLRTSELRFGKYNLQD